ncbi:hypothetical protein MesoLjLb_59580 [Mesorhizobium sp. L-8-3]|nr:hypothetical protein MesoLjLb_59580 [Mesorhizobium sp. L-8-3]
MQRNGQFDHAQAGAKVPAGPGDGIDQFGAQFGSDLRQVAFRQPAKVRGGADFVQKRRHGD